MKYRTKLYLALVAVAFTSIILGFAIFFSESEKLVYKLIGSRSESIVVTAATLLDGELFGKIKDGTPMNSPEYIHARNVLRSLANANRRVDVYVADIYTLYPDPKDPSILRYGVESDDDPFTPGEIYQDTDKDLIVQHLAGPIMDPSPVADQFGIWISGYAPIRDRNGKYVATLGVDLDAADIYKSLFAVVQYGIWGLISSLILAIGIAYYLSKKVTQSLDHLCTTVHQIGLGDFTAEAHLETKDEFGELSNRINEMTKGLKERDRLKVSFARYVSQHIMEKILASETPLKLEGERRKVTLLFSDIRQFTLLAEQLPPEAVLTLLNEYFEQMIEVIFKYNGTLDKFIGDGIMAEFGAPLDDVHQEKHAVAAALEMQKMLDVLCQKWLQENRPTLKIGIGIHTGVAVVGNVGSERRTEYTAIGDTVNVAARLEQATKILKVPLLISETTYLGCKNDFSFKDLGSMALPGRKEQIKVYTVNEKLPETKATGGADSS